MIVFTLAIKLESSERTDGEKAGTSKPASIEASVMETEQPPPGDIRQTPGGAHLDGDGSVQSQLAYVSPGLLDALDRSVQAMNQVTVIDAQRGG